MSLRIAVIEGHGRGKEVVPKGVGGAAAQAERRAMAYG